jgi:hypothetical protein
MEEQPRAPLLAFGIRVGKQFGELERKRHVSPESTS